MTDWRQIQARIRKAKSSPEALSRLSALFEKTHDAMVAFELASLREKAGESAEAIRWYTTAAERFRRAEWKRKALAALTRLGASLPTPVREDLSVAEASTGPGVTQTAEVPPLAETRDRDTEAKERQQENIGATHGSAAPARAGEHRRQRRGRRGGRRHRRPGGTVPVSGRPSVSEALRLPESAPRAGDEPPQDRQTAEGPVPVEAPPIPSERVAYGRANEPPLASRMAHLESRLRRLISSPLHRLEGAEEAPAGPGVFLLSDSDLVTFYYVEACQTLRVGLGKLLPAGRGGRGGRGTRGAKLEASLRSHLARHLGITEAKVSQYMKEHCVVRWIQLDEEPVALAHFAIAVLRPVLNT